MTDSIESRASDARLELTSDFGSDRRSPASADAKKAVYFISDLHLESSYPRLVDAFEQFLQEAEQDATAIYILGDFFNAWIGDDNESNFISHIRQLLLNCSLKGIDLYFIHGNRDFLIGELFAKSAGMVIKPEGTIIKLFGQRAILLHGDSLCIDDTAYQAFRQKVRDPKWQAKMLKYPLWVRKLIAWYMRKRSQKANSNKAENIMDVNQAAVEQVFSQSHTTLMIHGHTHRPNRHQYQIDGQSCERIVLGDWGAKLWYLKATEDSLEQYSQVIPE